MGARRQLAATQRALVEMHAFIVHELDPDPAPIDSYVVGPVESAAARAAIAAGERAARRRRRP
jgi:hypothetical protein